jgi:hypothetical protein
MPSAFSQSEVVAGPLVGAPGSLIASGRTVTWTVEAEVAWTEDRDDDGAALPVAGSPVAVPPAAEPTVAGSVTAGPAAVAAAAVAAVTAAMQEARVTLARRQAP